MATEAENVSRNAMYVLFSMVGLLAFTVGAFVGMLAYVTFTSAEMFGVAVGVFSAAIGVEGTIVGTLIQNLWGK